MNGRLDEAQADALAPFVEGQEVLDLGACDLALSKHLVEAGATKVYAVDKEQMPPPPAGVETVRCYFHNLSLRAPVAFVSWPVNWDVGLVPILDEAEIVVYLGKNTDASACGDQNLWAHLRTREVLAYVPARKNTLTVYGPSRVERGPTGEERASASVHAVMSYEDAEGYSEL